MSSFSLLKNASCNKPYCAFSNLSIGDYLVTDFALVETKYGPRLRVDLGEKILTLPERYARDMTHEKVLELNDSPKWMSYYGRDPRKNNKILLDFKTMEEFAASAVEQPNSYIIKGQQN